MYELSRTREIHQNISIAENPAQNNYYNILQKKDETVRERLV